MTKLLWLASIRALCTTTWGFDGCGRMGFSAVGIVETRLWMNREDDDDGTDSHIPA